MDGLGLPELALDADARARVHDVVQVRLLLDLQRHADDGLPRRHGRLHGPLPAVDDGHVGERAGRRRRDEPLRHEQPRVARRHLLRLLHRADRRRRQHHRLPVVLLAQPERLDRLEQELLRPRAPHGHQDRGAWTLRHVIHDVLVELAAVRGEKRARDDDILRQPVRVIGVEDRMVVDQVQVGHVHVEERDGALVGPAALSGRLAQVVLPEDGRLLHHDAAGEPREPPPRGPRQARHDGDHVGQVADEAMAEGARVERDGEEVDGADAEHAGGQAGGRPHAVEDDVGLELAEGGQLALDEPPRDLRRPEELGEAPPQVVRHADALDARLRRRDREPRVRDHVLEPRPAREERDPQVQVRVRAGGALVPQRDGHGDRARRVARILEGHADYHVDAVPVDHSGL